MQKILFICLSGAGDVLMSTPLVREIRQNYPCAKIDFLVMQGKVARDVLINNKNIDDVILFNFISEGYWKSLLFCNEMRKKNYDLSITTYPQARVHYSIVSYLIHAKKRIGFNYDTQKFKINNIFFTDAINEDFSKHVIENNLNVLDILGLEKESKKIKLIFELTKESREFADKYFKENKINKAVVVHPGSGTTKNFILKRWPKERFAELCKKIVKKKKVKIILVGGPDENELKNWIIKKSELEENKEIFNLHKQGIERESGVMKKSSLVISNDGVMAHLAAAIGTEVIGIFGPTPWEQTGPYTDRKKIVCKNKGVRLWKHGEWISKEQAETMKKIKVGDVYQAVDEMLK
ncbi:MAG: glycosyltransferase family 9 protein [Nanoarchaeota archaeon]|nr:glycosyltransferase family 9 protein [Nanoarchaeota archaeon]